MKSSLQVIHTAANESLYHIFDNVGRHCEILFNQAKRWALETGGERPIHVDREDFRDVVEHIVRIAYELAQIRAPIEDQIKSDDYSHLMLLLAQPPESKDLSSLGTYRKYQSHHELVLNYCNWFINVICASAALPEKVASLSYLASILENPRNKSLVETHEQAESFWRRFLFRDRPRIHERKIRKLTDDLLPRTPRVSPSQDPWQAYGSWGLPSDLSRFAIFDGSFLMPDREYRRIQEELSRELRLAEKRVGTSENVKLTCEPTLSKAEPTALPSQSRSTRRRQNEDRDRFAAELRRNDSSKTWFEIAVETDGHSSKYNLDWSPFFDNRNKPNAVQAVQMAVMRFNERLNNS